MKFTREIKTGILAICAIALLIFGYSFLKGKNLLENDRTFYAVYDNVEGLIPSSPVTINGLVVGQVVAIRFADNSGKLLVEMNVNKDFVFSKNSFAEVYGGGLIGGKSLAIIPKYEQGQDAKSGDTLPSRVDPGLLELVNERLTPLQEKLELAITDADTVLKALVSDRNKNNIDAIFSDLRSSVHDFKATSRRLNLMLAANEQKLNTSFDNLDKISTNLSKVSDSLSKVNVVQISKKLESVLASFDKISNDLNAGTGTAGKLLKDDKLYDNLSKTSKELELLLQDLRLNPTRYINVSFFGKKNKPYVKPADSLINSN